MQTLDGGQSVFVGVLVVCLYGLCAHAMLWALTNPVHLTAILPVEGHVSICNEKVVASWPHILQPRHDTIWLVVGDVFVPNTLGVCVGIGVVHLIGIHALLALHSSEMLTEHAQRVD